MRSAWISGAERRRQGINERRRYSLIRGQFSVFSRSFAATVGDRLGNSDGNDD
jgi:hypothetical protein